MTGIIRYGSYVPYFRLQRSGLGLGSGERAVASFDEDSVSMAVEAARDALDGTPIDTLLFATTNPPYAEKLNAATIQAALNLPGEVRSIDLGGTSRMGLTGLSVALDLAKSGGSSLVCAGDVVIGAPGGTRENQSGDGAVAFITGPEEEALAKIIGSASATTELLDVWRLPNDAFAKQWEERFGAEILSPIVQDTAIRALKVAGIKASELTTILVDTTNSRAVSALPKALGLTPNQVSDNLIGQVGRTGTAHAGLLLARALDIGSSGDRVLVISVADGCEAMVFEFTDKLTQGRPKHTVDNWIEAKRNDLDYNTYLKWREILPFEPPRRPDPARPAAPPMRRAQKWKMALVGSRCVKCNTGHLPPQRVCVKCKATDQMKAEPFQDTSSTITTYTLDHLAYTLQPPVVAAILDFDNGGRLSCELTDVDPEKVKIGDKLEMTFRRLYTAQGVHNYFWKARPRR